MAVSECKIANAAQSIIRAGDGGAFSLIKAAIENKKVSEINEAPCSIAFASFNGLT